MPPVLLVTIYSILIVLASLAGGRLPSIMRLTHTTMHLLMSFVGGLMLGVGLLHLLPHGIAYSGSVDLTVGWTMIGLLVMFFLIRIFQFHQHNTAEEAEREKVHQNGDDQGHGPGDSHAHAPAHSEYPSATGGARFGWLGIAFGLALHSLIDGVALGAAVVAEASHGSQWPVYGLAIFVAVFAHKPLDALSITSLMRIAGWDVRSQQLVNAGFAATCPLGAYLVVLGLGQHTGGQSLVIGCMLGFSAGVFLCISLGDLLPELQFHKHDRIKLSGTMLLGVALAYAIGFFEPPHAHQHQDPEHIHEHHHEMPVLSRLHKSTGCLVQTGLAVAFDTKKKTGRKWQVLPAMTNMCQIAWK